MDSTLATDPDLAATVHALARLAQQPPDRAFVRAQLAAANAALGACEAALADPLAEIDAPARRAYHAALVLAATNETSIQRTAARMLEVFDTLVRPVDRALRERVGPRW